LIEYVPLSEENVGYAVGLAQELHHLGYYGIHGPTFNWGHCKAMMLYTIHQKDYYFRLAMVDEQYIGAVCGKVVPFYFSPDMMGIEDAWYVRNGTHGRAAIGMKLMHGFVNWCFDIHKAVLVQSGDVAGINTVGVDALYRHMGFTRFGSIYKYVRT